MDDTLWKHDEKKFKPINKQAALIVRPANWLCRPPIEESKPKMAPTLKERIDEQNRLLMEKIKLANKEADERLLRRAMERSKKAAAKQEKPKLVKNKWAIAHLRQQAHSRGLPRPTLAECRAYAAQQPGYGKPL